MRTCYQAKAPVCLSVFLLLPPSVCMRMSVYMRMCVACMRASEHVRKRASVGMCAFMRENVGKGPLTI